MEVKDLRGYSEPHWLEVRGALESGTYRPSPVRQLGIPTVLERLIQLARAQVFSLLSYGCRPGRSAPRTIQK